MAKKQLVSINHFYKQYFHDFHDFHKISTIANVSITLNLFNSLKLISIQQKLSPNYVQRMCMRDKMKASSLISGTKKR